MSKLRNTRHLIASNVRVVAVCLCLGPETCVLSKLDLNVEKWRWRQSLVFFSSFLDENLISSDHEVSCVA